jgi:HSP90 family molecular chaperone
VKKSIDMITDIAEDSEKYLKFYEQFSKNLKVSDIS